MVNIEQITSRLAKLPDHALQQYAMMHKEDPYIMALAVSESRRRKQMRAAAAPQPQAQPKVAEQALMEMGVDALPTGEMNFASGGIVAFADGGDVERYDGSQGSLTGESFFAQLDQDKANQLAQLNTQLAQINPLLIAASRSGDRQAIQQYSQQAQAIRNQINAVRESAGNRAAGIEALAAPKAAPASAPVPAAAPVTASAAAPTASAASARDDTFRRQTDPRMLGISAAPSDTPMQYGGVSKPKPKDEQGLGATPEADALRKMTSPAAKTLSVEDAKTLAGQFLDTKSLQKDLEKYQKEEEKSVEEARKRRAEGKPEGKAYSKYEEMLAAEGAKEGKERDDAVSTAILRLGIGMMGGTSPNAFKNIADAAGPALTEYGSALKDLKKSAKERQKAMADIENARRAEERDDWKAKNEFEDKAETRMANARKYGIEFIKDLSGKGAEISSKVYDRQITEQGLDRRAQLQASTTLASRPYDLQGEYAKALVAGDEKKAASLLKAIQSTAAAKKPGLDMSLLKTFESLPGVKTDLETLNTLQTIRQPKPEALKQIADIKARLLQKAKANNIDPEQVGLSAASTMDGGQRTIDFNAIP